MLSKIQKWLSNLSDNLAKRHTRKINMWDNGDDPGLRFLRIPFIGGFLYLASSFNRANRLVWAHKQQQKEKQRVREITKERNSVRYNITRQINDALLESTITVITVPPENMTEFLEAIKGLDVGVKQLEQNKFMITAKEGVVL